MKAAWSYKMTELGAGIECSKCHHKIKAMTVVMGDVSLDICPFCRTEMVPITQILLNRMKDEVETRWN